jgi:hypothetical protein
VTLENPVDKPLWSLRLRPTVEIVFDCPPYVLDRMIQFWRFKEIDVEFPNELTFLEDESGDSDMTETPELSTCEILVGICKSAREYDDASAYRMAVNKLRHHFTSEKLDVTGVGKALELMYPWSVVKIESEHRWEFRQLLLQKESEGTDESVSEVRRIILSGIIRNTFDIIGNIRMEDMWDAGWWAMVSGDYHKGYVYYYQVYPARGWSMASDT